MSEYEGLDEATLAEKLEACTSYEERSKIRSALRNLKKKRGEAVGRHARKGASGYNRFAASSTPKAAPIPKSYIKSGEPEAVKSPSKSPAGKSESRSNSRQSSTPSHHSDHEAPPITPTAEDLPPRPSTPTPPPTPEYEKQGEPELLPPRLPSPPPRSPSPPPRSPSPPPRSPSPPPRSPSPPPRSPSPPPRSPSPPPRSPSPPPRSPSPQEDQTDSVPPHTEEIHPPSPSPPEEDTREQEPSPELVRNSKEPPPEPQEEIDSGPQQEKGDDEPDEAPVPSPRPLRSREPPPTAPRTKTGGPEFQGFKLRQTQRDKGEAAGKKEGKYDFGVKLKLSMNVLKLAKWYEVLAAAAASDNNQSRGMTLPRPLQPRESRHHPATTDVLPLRAGKASDDSFRQRAKTYASPRQTGSGSAPKTLADYQQITAKAKVAARSRVRSSEDEEEGPSMPTDDLHRYLVAYVNRELSLHPPLPVRGKALFDTCSNPTMLCKLINTSVAGTVDLRALTKIPLNASPADKQEGLQENMTLVIESGRAIGCRVVEETGDKILERDPQSIRTFLVDLIRARVVHLPGMEDEPSTTFTNMATLFKKLDISVEGDEDTDQPQEERPVSWREEDTERFHKSRETSSPTQTKGTWREKPVSPPPKIDTDKPTMDTNLSYEERAALRKAERDRRMREYVAATSISAASTEGMSYEERAAMRKAERERRRREREAAASAK